MEPTPPKLPTQLELPTLRQSTRPLWKTTHKVERVGQKLGNYRIIRLLAEGGFAEVYLGEHIHLNRYAAIKILNTQLSPEDLEEFRKESRIVARLRHPHIVSILDFDVQDDIPFLVMDYAPNGTLRYRHPKGSLLSTATILPYLKQTADALQYAHDERLIHRDIKPENMLIGQRNEILLSDFGIAVILYSSHSQTARDIVGTIAYIAPEQLEGRPCFASDQYALGVVVYEWLCGECPFRGSIAEIAAQHINAQPPPLCDRVPNLPPALESAVLKALRKDPEQRYPSVLDFVYAFEAATYSQPLQLQFNGSSQNPSSEIQNLHSSATIQSTFPALPVSEGVSRSEGKRSLSRRTLLLGLAGITAVSLTGGGLAWFVSRRPHAKTHPPMKPTPTPTPIPLGTVYHTYRGHHDIVNGLTWSPDETDIASGSSDKTVQVWDAYTGGVSAFAYTGHTDVVNAVQWSPDGSLIASGSADKTVQVWKAADGSNPVSYAGHTDVVNAVAWSPDNKYIASASNDKSVHMWNVADGSNLYNYTGHTDAVYALAWSPLDGSRIASASADKTVQVWNAADGSKPYSYTGHSDAVHAVAWSPDQKYIASGSSDKTVRVWKADTGELAFIYGNHADAVLALAWSPDGTRIASAGNDKTVQIWNAFDGGNPFVFQGHAAAVHGITWSTRDGGKFIASGGADTTVQIWQAS